MIKRAFRKGQRHGDAAIRVSKSLNKKIAKISEVGLRIAFCYKDIDNNGNGKGKTRWKSDKTDSSLSIKLNELFLASFLALTHLKLFNGAE